MKMSKNLKMILMVGVASIALAACSDTDISSPGTVIAPPSPPPPPPPPMGPDPINLVPDSFDATVSNNVTIETITRNGQEIQVAAIRGILTSDLTLEAGVGYFLDNTVFVGQDAGSGATSGTGVTLTIEPGATIYGAGDFSGLVVTRGSDIVADGTAVSPIVFSSLDELQRQQGTLDAPVDGEPRAEWLGLVLNGFAPINNCNDASMPGSADCQDDGEASSGLFGGGMPADNSGILDYVRVEYAGVFYNEEDQSNGIAFQGVGSGTQVSNIQVHNNGDDGVEFFGGTVSATNVVITGAADDAVDWTDGWTGSLQRVLVLQSDDDGDYAIEADNRSVSAADTEPRSNPKIANFTFIGNGGTNGIRLREGTAVALGNGIITNFATGIRFDDEPTANLFQVGPGPDGNEILISGNLFNATNTSRDSINDQGTEDESDDVVVFTAAQNTAALVDAGNAVDVAEIAAPFTFVPGPNASVAAQRDEFGNPLFLGSDGLTYAAGDAVPDGVTLTALTEVQVLGTAVAQVAALPDPGDLVQLDFIGAFAPDETVDDNWAAGWTVPGSVFDDVDPVTESCPTSPRIEQAGLIGDSLVCAVSGTVTENLTLPAFDNVLYRLDGQVFVGIDQGGAATMTDPVVLTIEPGVTIFGESSRDGLVVTRGNQINAAGTAAAPIVFTSGPAVRGTADFEADSAQWLGLSINGRAPINTCADADLGTAACEDDGEGNAGLYGGNVSDDSSGTLSYVRVEFAGIFLSEEDQSNGIQFLGTGSGTTIDHIQVHNNGDDGIEFFGGTASGKYFVITGARDDSFDWTDGWQGNVQYLLIEQNESDYAFEGDNRSESDPDRAPISTPQIANFTIVGANAGRGARFREGMQGTFANGIWGKTTTGIDIDDDDGSFAGGSQENLEAGTLVIDTHFIDSPTPVVGDPGQYLTGVQITALLENITTGTTGLDGFSFFGRAGIGVEPGTTEAGITPFDMTSVDADFFDNVDYIGAVNPAGDDWYLGWTVDSEGNVTTAE